MLKFLLVPVIMACAVDGTVGILKAIQKDTPPSIVIEEPSSESPHFDTDWEEIETFERSMEGDMRASLRKRIASSSVQILRSQGMSDEEIKAELLRDFSLTEEEVDKILEAQ